MTKPNHAWAPLFVTSTTRSGSTLLTQMLSAHPDMMVAADPMLPLFQALRNAVLTSRPELQLDPTEPFQDYYFTTERIAVLDAIQESSLELPVDTVAWPALLCAIRDRAQHECSDLVSGLVRLSGPTFERVIRNGLALVADVRKAGGRRWIGLKEVWIIEFYALLARAFPEARFVVLVRDPRAVAASNLGAAQSNPDAVGHMLSYARHWRKYVAFTIRYQHDPALQGRLHFLRYEDLVRAPEKSAADVCEFLGVPFHPEMLDARRYTNYRDGGPWQGNSTFEQDIQGISASLADSWRKKLDSRVWKLMELTCGSDMLWAGYEPTYDALGREPDASVLEYLLESDSAYANWRTDLRDIQTDFGCELFRRSLLQLPNPGLVDAQTVRRNFLFEEAFAGLRGPDCAAAGGKPAKTIAAREERS